MIQFVLYHHAFVFGIFTCILSQLDSNTLYTKKLLAHTHIYCALITHTQDTEDKKNKNWSLLLRRTLSTGGSKIHKWILKQDNKANAIGRCGSQVKERLAKQ